MTEQTSQDSSIRERKYLPQDTRMQLYGRVRELSGLGLGYIQIQDAILTGHQVRLAKSTISVWVNGLHDPTGDLTTFGQTRVLSLHTFIGVILGDGNLNIHGYNAELILAVTDYEFAKEFSRCLAIVLQREHQYTVRWHARKNRWVVQGSSVLLYNFLHRNWSNFKKLIEHCECAASYLRAFYDGEGCVRGRRLTVANTNMQLLLYTKHLLNSLGTVTLEPHLVSWAGTSLEDPHTGRIYERRKDCYQMDVRASCLPRFNTQVGFTISRKKTWLEYYARRSRVPIH